LNAWVTDAYRIRDTVATSPASGLVTKKVESWAMLSGAVEMVGRPPWKR